MKAIELNNAQIDIIVNLYRTGKSLDGIGKSVGINKHLVKKILQRNGIEVKKPERISQEKIGIFIKEFERTGSTHESKCASGIGQKGALRIIKEYRLFENRKCIYCGSADILKLKNGNTCPCCPACKDIHFKKIAEVRKQSNLEKYGVSNVAQLDTTKEKFKKTCIEKYGEDNPLKNKDIKRQAEDTLEKNYGVRVPSKNKEIQEKIEQTNLERYGFENVHQNDEIKKRAEEATVLRYGTKNGFQSEEIKESIKKKVKEKYGVEYTTQIPEFKEKARKTFLSKYGVSSAQQIPEAKVKARKTLRNQYWDTFLEVLSKRYIKPCFDKKEYIDSPLRQIKSFECQRCKKIIESDKINPHQIFCECGKHRSYFEDDIITWLQAQGITNIKPNEKYYENGKLKFEIDIYLPDYNLGIDFNGIYWHSDLYRSRSYHQNKYKYFKEKNIQLIQIFENEWVNKESIVKSILLNKLGVNTKIFARKCSVREVDSVSSTKFLEQNHLQSSSSAGIRIGLYYNEELVCLGAFGKFRYKNEDAYEIIRFAGKLGHTIIGGFERILKHFEIEYAPKKIISFVDVRYFTGNSYKNFINTDLTQPNYFYFKDKDKTLTLWSRVKFQKHKLKDKLKIFDPVLSEYENMLNNGYLRIFDAGNLKMVKTY